MNDAPVTHVAYLGLGSNIGDRERRLIEAVAELNGTDGIEVAAVSSLYETDPVGLVDQPPFINMAARIVTSHGPLELLGIVLALERRLGRVRTIRWGPRTIDIDLLLFDERVMDTPELTLPHPRMHERAFVMIPLLEVLSLFGGHHPQVRTVDFPEHNHGVKLWRTSDWPEEFGLSVN